MFVISYLRYGLIWRGLFRCDWHSECFFSTRLSRDPIQYIFTLSLFLIWPFRFSDSDLPLVMEATDEMWNLRDTHNRFVIMTNFHLMSQTYPNPLQDNPAYSVVK